MAGSAGLLHWEGERKGALGTGNPPDTRSRERAPRVVPSKIAARHAPQSSELDTPVAHPPS